MTELQGMVRNILQGGLANTELLQSYVRAEDDYDDEDNGRGPIDKSKVKPPISSLAIPLAKGGPIISTPPKRDIYTPRVRKETSNMSEVKTLAAEQQSTGAKEKPPKGSRGKSKSVKGKLSKSKKGRRRKKRGLRGEEVYTDKDRAAAVNMGSKDIKHSLSMKMKQDRSRTLQIPEEAEPGTFLALGNNEIRNGGDVNVAMGFVNKALELNPKDKEALVARSRCYILLGDSDRALEDAETALGISKNYIPGIYQKAEALYFLGQFEHSLMYYHRGLRIRPELQKFRLGVQKAQEAIENTIGPAVKLGAGLIDSSSQGSTRPPSRPGTRTFRDRPKVAGSASSLSDTRTIGTRASLVGQNSRENVSKSSSHTRIPRTTSTPVITTTKNSTRQLLGALSVDKMYLENLLKQPHLKCLDKENKAVISKAEEALAFLNNRQKFWQQQLPPPGLCKKRNSSAIAHR